MRFFLLQKQFLKKFVTKYGQDESGSIMLMVLLILSLVTVLGLSSSKTTWIEMNISNNQTVHKLNFYQAEGAINEGMQILEDTDLKNNTFAWVQPKESTLLTPGDNGNEVVNVYSDDIWDDNSQGSQSLPTAQMMSAYRGTAPGYSLTTGQSTVYLYDVYGRSQQNNGLSIIKMSYRKAY